MTGAPNAVAALSAINPTWSVERVEEARIHYSYGVNSGTLQALNTPESIRLAVRSHEHLTMGPIGVDLIETRTRITATSPWLTPE